MSSACETSGESPLDGCSPSIFLLCLALCTSYASALQSLFLLFIPISKTKFDTSAQLVFTRNQKANLERSAPQADQVHTVRKKTLLFQIVHIALSGVVS